MSNGRVQMEGSAPNHAVDAQWSPVPSELRIDATLYLRRKPGVSPGMNLSREEAEQALSADPADVRAIRAFAADYQLTVAEVNTAARTAHVEGSLAQMGHAFGVELRYVEDANGLRHISYQANLTVPSSLAGVVVSVLGLDRRSIAKHA